MKKTFKYMTLAVAAMSMAACSSDDLGLNDNESIADTAWNADGEGYVKFSISMPGGASDGRRKANNQFDNGLATEYDVKNGILLIFGGEGDETTAQLSGAYNLPLDTWTDYTTGTPNITRDQIFTQKISRMGGSKAYAMVVLNHNDFFEVTGTELKVNGSIFSGTITDLQKLVINNAGDGTGLDGKDRYASNFYKNGFLMMNAPLATVAGGTNEPNGSVQTLAPITRDNIKPTEAEAKAAVAANIYVERAVSKVTMQQSPGGNLTSLSAMTWKLKEWALDNTNKKTYLVRNTTNEDGNMKTWRAYASGSTAATGVNHFRFVGEANCNTGHANLAPTTAGDRYRTYFAQDPNYGKYEAGDFWYNKDGGSFNVPANVWTNEFGTGKPKYCLENTFNVRQQIWGATTRVIIKAELNNGNTFYTTQEGTDVYYDEAGVKNLALNNYVNSAVLNSFINNVAVKSANTSALTVAMSGTVFTVNGWVENSNITFRTKEEIQQTLNAQNFSAEFWNPDGVTDYTDDGWQKIVGVQHGTTAKYSSKPAGWVTLAEAEAMVKTMSDIPTYAQATATSPLHIYVYTNGVTYYEARIKHFGNDATPWNDWETGEAKPSVTTGAYPGETAQAEGNYLGRWGVLRNNWYDLNVTSIAKIGYATPPSLEKTSNNTDDELDQFISVDVNILSWAKRTQDVAL